MRFLNGFVLIGITLLFISIGGVASGNRLLTEPGQQPNPQDVVTIVADGITNALAANGLAASYVENALKRFREKLSGDSATTKETP